VVARKLRDKGKIIAAHLFEADVADIEFSKGKYNVKGSPDNVKTIQDIAFAAYTNIPDGIEAGLEGVTYYDPPNMTFPFGTYLVVVDIDKGTGQVKVRRMVAVDDCGVRINPMIVEGQIHGGLTEGFGIAFMELITFDDDGNCIGSNFMDYLIPTAWETPRFELGETVTPSPHHPIGAKGVGESPNVGGVPCFSNAVNDAFSFLGSTHIQMPHDHWRTWTAAEKLGLHG
jgi:aerobic carbon-monoxide dehydrogenase large subunit